MRTEGTIAASGSAWAVCRYLQGPPCAKSAMKLHSSPVVAVLVAGAALATLAANAHQNEADDEEEEPDAAAASAMAHIG